MNIRTLTIAFALFLTQPAIAQMKTEIESFELAPSNIILPASVNGMVTFQACSDEDDCDADFNRARLTATTQFVVNGEAVRFEDFQQDFSVIKLARDGYALLSVDTDSNTITSIQIQG